MMWHMWNEMHELGSVYEMPNVYSWLLFPFFCVVASQSSQEGSNLLCTIATLCIYLVAILANSSSETNTISCMNTGVTRSKLVAGLRVS
jgi:hypothetical protein